jgi:hypothetical protein
VEHTAYSPERLPPSLAHASAPLRPRRSAATPGGALAPQARPPLRLARAVGHARGRGPRVWARRPCTAASGGTRAAEPWEDTRPTPPCLAAGGLPRRWAALP